MELPDPDEVDVWDLMESYPNFYFSVDVDHILQRIPWECGLLDCYSGSDDAVSEFVTTFDSNLEAMVDQALERYQPIIETHPDQFLWGTENVGDYSFDPEVYGRAIAFSRAFIGSLDISVQEKIAYQNAERVFGPGVPPPKTTFTVPLP